MFTKKQKNVESELAKSMRLALDREHNSYDSVPLPKAVSVFRKETYRF
jgi:hypothetical protein